MKASNRSSIKPRCLDYCQFIIATLVNYTQSCVALPTEEAAEAGHEADYLAQRRWRLRGGRRKATVQPARRSSAEKAASHGSSGRPRPSVTRSGDGQVERERPLQALPRRQLQSFDLAAAF